MPVLPIQHGYLALGSNLGDRWQLLDDALVRLQRDPSFRLIRASQRYRSKPWGFVSANDFLNQVIEVEWTGLVTSLLALAKQIELDFRGQQVRLEEDRSIESEALTDKLERRESARLVAAVEGAGLDAKEIDEECKKHQGRLEKLLRRMAHGLEGVVVEQGQPDWGDHGWANPARKYFDRQVDIDLLYFDNLKLQTEHLTLPHPRAHLRAFVLLPLYEIEPGLKLKGKSLAEWIAQLPEDEVRECKSVSASRGS